MKIYISNHLFPKATQITLEGPLVCEDQPRLEQYIRTLLFGTRILLLDCQKLEQQHPDSLIHLVQCLQGMQGENGKLVLVLPRGDCEGEWLRTLNLRCFDSVEGALMKLSLEAA